MKNLLSAPNPQYASGATIVIESLKAFLPPEPANVADFAAANRWLSNEGGGYVGRWNHEEAPYLIAPMEALSDDRYLTVAIVGPGQCGKTEIARNWLLTTALSDPADMLWYSGSEPLVTTEVKVHTTRLIQDHPALAQILADNSLAFKRFGSMSVQFLAGIMSNFISKSGPRLVGDEWDMICKAIPAAKALLDVRRQTFGRRSKLLALSHPDLVEGYNPKDWNAGIMELYRDSTRKIWYWPCPHCGAWSSPNPTAKLVMPIHYDDRASDDEIAEMAMLCCPVNGCMIEDSQRRAMNLHGAWVGQGQEIDQDGQITGAVVNRDADGYWITGAMSPFVIGGLGALALARVRAERKFAIDGDRKPLAQVMSKQWGYMLERDRSGTSLDATVIAERADVDLVLGEVANGVRFITVMIDVQANRFELLARGWCPNGESVVVDFRKIEANPGTSEADWDDVLRFATEYAWPLADGSGRGMRALTVGFDTSGTPGVTLQAYEAWKRLKARGGVKMLGRINGRPAYNVLPMKGASTMQAPRLQIVFPNAQRTDRFAQARGEIPLGIFNPNLFKDDLNDQLMLADGGPWSIRFPAALAPERAAPFAWFEQLVAEDRGKNGRWARRRNGQPNEALDLMVGCHVLATMMGILRIKWGVAEPQWALEWDKNRNVVKLAPSPGGVYHDARAAGLGGAPLPDLPAADPPRVAPVVAARNGPGAGGVRFVTSIPVRRP